MTDRIEQIRRAYKNAQPKPENPAWCNTHRDLGVVLDALEQKQADIDNMAHKIGGYEVALEQAQSQIGDLQAKLNYHVHEPVDDDDPVLAIGHRLADLLQGDDWNNIEAMLNGLSEHCRNKQEHIDTLETLNQSAKDLNLEFAERIGRLEAALVMVAEDTDDSVSPGMKKLAQEALFAGDSDDG